MSNRPFSSGILLTLLVIAVFMCSCGGSAREDLFADDKAARRELRSIRSKIASTRSISKETLSELAGLNARFPASEEVRNEYVNALVIRKDWKKVADVLSGLKEDSLTDRERDLLARSLFNRGQYASAAVLLEALADERPDSLRLRVLLAKSYFFAGSLKKAGNELDAVLKELKAGGRANEIALLGTIYFRLGRKEEAVRALETALTIDPSNIAANNSLSRLYAKEGDTGKAGEYSRRAAAAKEELDQRTLAASRIVARKMRLERAWEKKEYRTVIELGNELIPSTESKTELLTLYEYLFRSYTAIGMQKKAEEIRQKANALR